MKYRRTRNNSDALCERRQRSKVSRYGTYPDGEPKYTKYCVPCKTIMYIPKFQYQAAKDTKCAQRGFEGHFSQLDVDHIDGNHNNHDPTNLQTLCSNCHRLKTYKEQQAKKLNRN